MAARLSVLISTRDRLAKLQTCLAAVERARAGLGDCTVVVVDNGSSDGTGRWLGDWEKAAPGRRALQVPTAGKARAVNAAVRQLDAELIALTDDDAVVSPSWLASMNAFLDRHPEYAAVTGPVEVPPEVTDADVLEKVRLYHFGLPFRAERGDEHDAERLVGANFAVRARAFAEVGGFDERLGPGALGFYDDDDLGERLVRRGLRIGYNPGAPVWHEVDPERLTLSAAAARAATIARCRSVASPGWLTTARAGARIGELAASIAAAKLLGNRAKEIQRRVRLAFFWETLKQGLGRR